MKKINVTSLSLFLLGIFFAPQALSGIINETQWVIQPGDTLYKIARQIHPGNAKKQASLRKQLVKDNPDVFKNGAGNISVGDRLNLPAKKPAVAIKAKPTPKPVMKKAKADTTPVNFKQAQQPATTEVTPDPEDIIGQVVINVGSLNATNRGSTRKLTRRSSILRGDTISTGLRTHSQIRLKDGALLALRPATNLRIAEYSYNGQQDGSERSLIELLRGGFRTITGAIGHKNKQNYRVKTSVATIGIRGTHYTLMLCQQQSCSGDSGGQIDDGLYGGVADGSIIIENQSGVHQFNNDQFFQVKSAGAAPVEFLQPPSILKTKQQPVKTMAKKDSTPQQPAQEFNQGGGEPQGQFAGPTPKQVVIIEPNQINLNRQPQNPLRILARPPTNLDAQIDGVSEITNTLTEFSGTVVPQVVRAPDGAGMVISFNYIDDTGAQSGVAAPVIANDQNGSEIFLSGFVFPDGNVAQNIPVEANDFSFDPDFQTVVEHNLRTAPVIDAAGNVISTGAMIVPSSLGGNPLLGVNWGRWNGDFGVREDGSPLNAQDDLHFMYSNNLTSPTQIAALGGINGYFEYNTVGGTRATDQQGNVAANLANVTMQVDFQAASVINYNVTTSVAGNVYSAGASDIGFASLQNLREIPIFSSVGCNSGPCSGQASVIFVGDQAQGAMNSYHIQSDVSNNSVTGSALLQRGATAVIPQ